MTSAISDIYDAIESFLSALYPDSRLINDPYNIDENDDLVLKRGFGFYMGPAFDRGTMGMEMAIDRELVVTLTIESGSSEHKSAKRMKAEKQLLEDHFQLLKKMHLDPTANEKISAVAYQNDNGIEFIFGAEKNNYLMIQSRFIVTYVEQLGV